MADFKSTIDFIKSVYGNKEFTPLAVPVFAGNEKAYLNECIDTTFVSSVGKFVDRFEEDMAKYTGAKRAVVCVSGTNALHMSLLLAGVKKNDEVLTQALTFIATCNALSYIGAHPVFLDVDKSTMGLSPDAMKEWLQANAEIRKNTRIAELPESHGVQKCPQAFLDPKIKNIISLAYAQSNAERIQNRPTQQESAFCFTPSLAQSPQGLLPPRRR